MRKLLFVTAWLMWTFSTSHVYGLSVSQLTCEMKKGLVVSESNPRLGWQLVGEAGEKQTAYEIEVVDALKDVVIWNSNKTISTRSQFIPTTLVEGIYRWRVRVWDEADMVSEWSPFSDLIVEGNDAFGESRWIGAVTRVGARLPEGRTFTGAELKKEEVKEAWASVDTLARKSIILRKEFKTKKKLKRAIVRVCGLGHYELTLNGTKVGQSEFAPLWSDYEKTVWYNTYDVTSQLKDGMNAIGVMLGNGFYNVHGGRYRKLQISFGPPTLRMLLTLHYEDGTHELVQTDESWKYDFSPITFNCIYGGESYDARLEQKGWDKAGFNAEGWRSVVLQESPRGTLRAQMAPPVCIMERYSPKQVTHLTTEQVEAACKSTKRTVDPSVIVLDMGQNLAGFPEIKVKGKRGDKVTLFVAESLTSEGACNQRQTGRHHYYEYTLKGNGVETWHPRFSYYGFRYIQVEGAVMKGEKNPKRLPVIQSIASCFVHNSAKKISTFECSNRIFNEAHLLIEKAVRSNMQSVFTDCPHREKLGWLEQDHLNGPGLLYNYDLSGYVPQTLRNIADAQHPNGAVPTTAPEYTYFRGNGMDVFAESPEWGCVLVILPFMYYEMYGDDSLIRTYYGNMRRYTDYLSTRAEGHILSFGLGDWYDYGDFRAGFSRNTPVPLVATAHYYLVVTHLVKAARMLGNAYDVAYYGALADEIKQAFNANFYQADTHVYGSGSQCSCALPLFLDLVPAEDRQEVLDNLVKDIVAHGNRLTTGDVGNRYLFQTLARNGLNELMYKMHNHEEAPGYGFQLKFGATTLTEQWDPRQGSSWNHFMMGQIDEWFFYSLAGIVPMADKPGMQEFIVAPQPVGDLTFVKASTETLYGVVRVEWNREGDMLTLCVDVPIGTKAHVRLPSWHESKIFEGGFHKLSSEIK